MDTESGPPRAEPLRDRRWGLGDAALGFFAGLVLSGVLTSLWLAASDGDRESVAVWAVGVVGLWAGLAGAPLMATWAKGRKSLAADFGLRARPVDVPTGFAIGLASQLVLVPLVAILLRPLVGRPEVSRPARELIDRTSGPVLLGVAVFLVIGAPLVEELFFRGLVLRALQHRIGDRGAIGVSAVLFGLVHPQPNGAEAAALVMVSLAVLGVVLAILALRTGRLGPSICAHAAFNGFTVAVLALT